MADVISALTKKRYALVNAKREIMQDAERRASEIDREIKNIDNALSTLNNAVKEYLCKTCGGTGYVRKMDAAGQMDDDTCPDCKGTGVKI